MNELYRTIETLRNREPLSAYIYDLPALKQHVLSMISALPDNAELFYAIKANPDARILDTLQPIVHGFEAASGGELRWLQQRHGSVPTLFGGPGKLYSEMIQALEGKVDAIHVESLTELQRLIQVCRELDCDAPILLRMNIPLDGIASTRLAMGGKPTPFGIDVSDLDTVIHTIQRHSRLKLKGFHFHLLSHQLSCENHLDLMRLYFRTFNKWSRQYHLEPPLLNVGGGMGINYSNGGAHFDWWRFCDKLHDIIASENMRNTTLRFECGRFVTGQCGYYVMEVLDIKKSHGEYFVVGRGGTHQFRTPAAQQHSHPFFIVPGRTRQDVISDINVTIVGQLCTPKDVLARQQSVDSVAIGDYLVFPLAGAYAWNISHQNFLMHPPPLVRYIGEPETASLAVGGR